MTSDRHLQRLLILPLMLLTPSIAAAAACWISPATGWVGYASSILVHLVISGELVLTPA